MCKTVPEVIGNVLLNEFILFFTLLQKDRQQQRWEQVKFKMWLKASIHYISRSSLKITSFRASILTNGIKEAPENLNFEHPTQPRPKKVHRDLSQCRECYIHDNVKLSRAQRNRNVWTLLEKDNMKKIDTHNSAQINTI